MLAVRPKPWTRHHTHRLFHVSMGLVFAYIVGMMSAGLVVAWWQTQAANDVSIAANIGAVEPGPTVIVPGAVFPPAPPAQNPRPDKPQVEVEPQTPSEQQTINTPSGTVRMIVFSSRRPLFKGTTNIPNALIFIEVHSEPITYGTTQANEQGNWQWRPPEDLAPGAHKLLVTARDPNDPKIFATYTLDFYIKEDTPSQEPKPIVPITTARFKKLFGVFLTIPSEHKVVSAGESVVASLRLYSYDDPSAKEIKYSVVGPGNDTLLEQVETLPEGEEIAFRKTFITHPGAASGLYTIHVKTPHLINTAVASDNFQIIPSTVGLAGTTVPITPLLIQALFAFLLLFIFLTFLAYRRIRALNHVIRQHHLKGI